MDAPRIQYCNAGNGLSIAYWTLGDGPALLMQPPLFVGHLGLEWEEDLLREWYIHLSQGHRLVRFDPLGEGLSSRGVKSFMLESWVSQIGAVVDRSQLARFDLVGFGTESMAVTAYAALHPERVQQAVLVNSGVRGSDFTDRPQLRAVISLLDADYRLFTETWAHLLLGGWGRSDAAHRFAKHMQDSISADDFRALLRDLRDWDVADLAPRVAARTLILHQRNLPFAGTRELASLIPDSRLVQVSDRHIFEQQEAWEAIGQFLEEGRKIERGVELPSGMTAILFADIAESTALTERLGDTTFRARARDLDGALRAVIRDHSGTPIEGKLLGDGVLAVFTSARQAIEAALACARSGDDAGLPLHLGLHAGDVIREEGNVYGGAVNVAARVSALSAAGEVLVSQTVRDLARTSAGVTFEDAGERELKGVGEAVRVWAVREGE